MFLQGSSYQGPCFVQVYLSIFWEEADKGRFFRECTTDIIRMLELFDLEGVVISRSYTQPDKGYKPTSHLLTSSVSQGLSFLYVEGIFEVKEKQWLRWRPSDCVGTKTRRWIFLWGSETGQ